jgi:hypothetical protein
LSEIRRVVKPEGRVSVVLHGVLTRRGPLAGGFDLLFRITGQGSIRRDELPVDDDWLRPYTRIVDLFAQQGLTGTVVPIKTPHGFAVVFKAQRTLFK